MNSFHGTLLAKLREQSSVKINGQLIAVPNYIIEKTADIFQDRVFVFFKEDQLTEQLAQQLFKLQLLIFLIDDYYEHHWQLQADEINPIWEEIKSVIHELGVAQQDVPKFLADIIAFEKIERDMRQGIRPDTVEIGKFYFLKSCDVRLQRHLFMFIQQGVVCQSTPKQINYDILGEILDDLDDLQEDSQDQTYNGNRLMFSLEKDKPAALTEYEDFALSIAQKYPKTDLEIQNLTQGILQKLHAL